MKYKRAALHRLELAAENQTGPFLLSCRASGMMIDDVSASPLESA